jgi:hypothetical protein
LSISTVGSEVRIVGLVYSEECSSPHYNRRNYRWNEALRVLYLIKILVGMKP